MAEEFIGLDLEGEDELILALERAEAGQKQRVQSLLDNLADFGRFTLIQNSPIFTSYLIHHVGRSLVVWRPGGAGGGGEYEVVFGVKAGSSKHPLYVEFGTGLYGAVGWWIVPLKAQYMVFYSQKLRRKIRTKKVRGQKPQRYFYTTWREMQIYAAGKVLALDLFN